MSRFDFLGPLGALWSSVIDGELDVWQAEQEARNLANGVLGSFGDVRPESAGSAGLIGV